MVFERWPSNGEFSILAPSIQRSSLDLLSVFCLGCTVSVKLSLLSLIQTFHVIRAQRCILCMILAISGLLPLWQKGNTKIHRKAVNQVMWQQKKMQVLKKYKFCDNGKSDSGKHIAYLETKWISAKDKGRGFKAWLSFT